MNKEVEELNSKLKELRANAEARLVLEPDNKSGLIQIPIELMHELRVQEVELKMQNEELIRAHVALEQSRAHYLDLYDFAPVGYLTLDDKGFILEINLTAAKLLKEDRINLVSKRFVKFIHDDYKELWYQHFLKAHQTAGKYECELPFDYENGNPVYFHLECLFIHDSESRSILRIILTDVTERKRTEHALSEANETFHLLVKNSPFGIYVVDSDFCLIEASRGTKKVFKGIEPLLGRDFADVTRHLWPQPFADDVLKRFKHTLATGEPYHATKSVERRLNIDEVEAYDWQIERITLPNGQWGVVCHFYDLSEHQQHETELRASEERFRAIFEHSAIGIVIADWDGKLLKSNAAFQAMLGYTPEELNVQSLYDLTYPEDRATNLAGIQRLKSQEQPYFEIENRYLHKTGEPVWVRKFVSVLPNHKGEPSYLVTLITDITEHRRLQFILREADHRKNEFLAMLGHELRNPLTPIANVAKLLGMPPHDERKILWASEILDRNVAHMSRLVDDLLDVSRITRGLVNIQRVRVELVEILKNAAETVHTLIQKKNQNLILNLPDPPLFLEGDPVRLTQVFTNLLNNASKYTDENGTITLTASTEGSSFKVRVQDNGMGIEASLLPHIFDIFMQNERGLARSEGGLGLGLTLVKKLVELHGGQISAINSGTQQGSEFVVTLPSLVEATAEPEQPLAPHLPMMTDESLKVLLVDENQDVVDSLTMAFDLWGHRVRAAYNGADGICAAQNFEPEVILLDIGLPDMDGYQVVKKLREQPALQNTLIIAQSGYVPNQGAFADTGFDNYLIKPAKLGPLKELITEFTRKNKSGDHEHPSGCRSASKH
jgi:PAS domain S-box-containing protein